MQLNHQVELLQFIVKLRIELMIFVIWVQSHAKLALFISSKQGSKSSTKEEEGIGVGNVASDFAILRLIIKDNATGNILLNQTAGHWKTIQAQ